MTTRYRMFLLHGDARYIDVFERTVYNGFLAGISIGGDHFFYPNPLEADGAYGFNHGATGRQEWFDCSCCPVNAARFLPEIAGCIYAAKGHEIYVNLFIGGEATVNLMSGKVHLEQTTGYPWKGQVQLVVNPERPASFSIHVRIPGWARGEVVPSDLYHDTNQAAVSYRLKVNGDTFGSTNEKGYDVLNREWHPGDRIEIEFAMPVRRVHANPAVKENAGRVALERGPLVYCVEGVDNKGDVTRLSIDDSAALEAVPVPELLGGLTVVRGESERDGQPAPFQAVPYHLWNNRGDGPMMVWLRRGSSGVGEQLP